MPSGNERARGAASGPDDLRALRDAFGAFVTGVTVVTALDHARAPFGFTANSFTSVSLDPPLVLVCLARSSANLGVFEAAPGFAVNVLSEAQQSISATFAMPVDDRFAAVEWAPGPHGSPVLDGVAAWFDCSTHDRFEGGDHVILVGRVEAFDSAGTNGLGYARGAYFTPALEERALAAAVSHAPVVLAAIVERDGAVLLDRDAGGALDLPSIPLDAAHGATSDLAPLFATSGLPVAQGFVYAVYEDRAAGRQHVVYRCTAEDGTPRRGEFHALESLDLERVGDAASRATLARYVEERRLGNFGIYFGDERRGAVRRPHTEGAR